MRKQTLLPALLLAIAASVTPALSADAPPARERLLHGMDSTEGLGAGGWKFEKAGVEMSPAGVAPKLGSGSVRFRGVAAIAGAKGDFHLTDQLPGNFVKLGMWVYLSEDSNVSELGFQLWDANGEGLTEKIPADWLGWRHIELDAGSSKIVPAWKQPDQNGVLEQPIRALNLAWFAKEPGPSHLEVDALTGVFGDTGEPVAPLDLKIELPRSTAARAPMGGSLVLHNSTGKPLQATGEYTLISNPQLISVPVADPVHGLDIARGAKAWTIDKDGEAPDPTLTDGLVFTNREIAWGNTEAEVKQRIDLGAPHKVTKLAIFPTDANWLWNAEVSASMDGTSFQVIPGMEKLDLFKRWTGLEAVCAAPVEARFIQLRYFKEGEAPKRFSLPNEIQIYDGISAEDKVIPELGGTVAKGKFSVEVPARSFAVHPLKEISLPEDGAYLLRVEVAGGGLSVSSQKAVITSPAPNKPEDAAASRFGINASSFDLADEWGPFGFGWVRFENMKWLMFSPSPGEFRFDGSVGPWQIRFDEFMKRYNACGMKVLPYIFMVPEYATSAGPEANKKMRASFPPKDPAEYGEAVFQVVARYGSNKVPADKLKSPDKLTGLNQIGAVEIWNEPNLNPKPDAGWGAWAGPLDQFWPVFRVGAEAAKAADPKLPVTSPGMAGLTLEVLEPLRKFQYPDGKTPLDFMDILNVHYYSGRQTPETATKDANVVRQGDEQSAITYPVNLRELIDWRNLYLPGKPIWLTETGYDSSGSHGIDERLQAARIPRVTLMALAAGVDKVFIYREAGSTPSQHAAAGLLRNDSSPKPSYFSVATLLRELAGLAQGPSPKLADPDPNIWLYAWETPKGKVLTAWTVNGEATLSLGAGECEVVDSFGGRRKVSGKAIPVGEFPVYIHGVGGWPEVAARLAAAKEAEAKRAAAEKTATSLRALLFDFGPADQVGILRGLGAPRNFSAVTGETAFASGLGFGFEKVPVICQEKKWMKDLLERDSCRLDKNNQFVFDVPPGKYTLTLSAGSIGAGVQALISLEGATKADGSAAAFEFGDKTPPQSAEVLVSSPRVRLSTDRLADLRWMTLVESDGKSPDSGKGKP
ncbi:MAG: hypothetical protein WCS65_04650 [Verrucomicrobiae bacterium]